MQEHEPTVDKDGREVSDFVAEAVEALRDHPDTAKVLCSFHASGRIQVWYPEKYVTGESVRLARRMGYELSMATTRDGDNQDFPSWSKIGYAEFTPEENRD